MGSLRALHISFAAEVRSTQKIRSTQIFVIPLTDSPMIHLTSLTLTELWRIDGTLLSMVSRAFPGLVSLHLSCSEHLDVSCCWACFEESSSAVVHSPIPNHFPTVASLTVRFSSPLLLDYQNTFVERIRKSTETTYQADRSSPGNIPLGRRDA